LRVFHQVEQVSQQMNAKTQIRKPPALKGHGFGSAESKK